MHVILAVTAIHDRYIQSPAIQHRSISEIYHGTQCAKLFNWKLSQPLQLEDRDALWATAAMLGIISTSSVEASNPEESWPLKPPESGDLEWLNIAEGKKAVWKLTDPSRSGSIFEPMFKGEESLFTPLPSFGIEDVPAEIVLLCNLNESSSPKNNPYFTAVHSLSRVLHASGNNLPGARSLHFFYNMEKPFKNMLEQKDPVALLLFALWYSTVPSGMWWVQRRAMVESQAIFLYLERSHKENKPVQALISKVNMMSSHNRRLPANLTMFV
jgi:hypothetical protein